MNDKDACTKQQTQNTNIQQIPKTLNGEETQTEQRHQHFLGCHENN